MCPCWRQQGCSRFTNVMEAARVGVETCIHRNVNVPSHEALAHQRQDSTSGNRQHSTPTPFIDTPGNRDDRGTYDPPTGSPYCPLFPTQCAPPRSCPAAVPAGACSAPRREDQQRFLPLRPLMKLLSQQTLSRPAGGSSSRCWRSWWCSWERTRSSTAPAGRGRLAGGHGK